MAKILIVEDDPLISRMYSKVFTFEGLDVQVARNGADGLKKMEEETPDLVILDIMMPKMTGIEVLDKMKSSKSLKRVPVVVLTNLSGMEDAEKAIEKGAVKFIVKSEHKPTAIAKQIKEILKAYTHKDHLEE